MKIVHLNTYDTGGGAARATLRLHSALKKAGIDSRMLVKNKRSHDKNVYNVLPKKNLFIKLYLKILNRLNKPIFTTGPFSSHISKFSNIIDTLDGIEYDILHIHWAVNDFLNLQDLERIDKPIVWTLHDNWLYTGGCHISLECKKYEKECGGCPVLQSDVQHDLSYENWLAKKTIISKVNLTSVIGLSAWISKCIENSTILKGIPITKIPNPIDTSVYQILDKTFCRDIWNIDNKDKVILFGAVNSVNDKNKGFEYLIDSLTLLDSLNTTLVVFGCHESTPKLDINIPVKYVETLQDEVSLITLYNTADVMIVPSLQESFGLTALEALACGIPVVCFDTTGLKDIVDHKKNGYRAIFKDAEDLATGIDWVLSNPEYDKLSVNARVKAVNVFDYSVVAPQYIDLYEKVLDEDEF